ncbi:hypothetical protein QSV08_13915 [Maribacter sp. BPC-D8]|uniref:hypothetical protein n=1 Tax=Maribacter sp. BPC-D8 TaxID=3053613 RepID=UPI002B49276A|nr:hypothetical protein [Maribacter sp. BPC-D8]WRI28316.1 hypothetical protein QSV08_13915 [Maribacter sp. BPC-D8]
MGSQPIHILRQLKKSLAVILAIAIIGEIIFFPTLANFYGCVMAIISFWIFSFFLKEKYIRLFPFAFCMYFSMFMYRYLPIIATIAEGKPISYGFERPFQTFIYEIILFSISSLAFYLACQPTLKNPENNIIQKSLYRLKFFETTPATLWVMGIIGVIIRIYNLNESTEYGDVGGKFLLGLNYLMYAPLCLIFPSLTNLEYNSKKSLWLYLGAIFIINIASNSRQAIITPMAIVALLFFLFLISKNLKFTQYLSKTKIVVFGIILFSILNLLSNISLAMLYNRNIRSKVNKLELFQRTIDTVFDDELMSRLKANKDKEEGQQFITYQQGWTEMYVDNFMLARYANMRITDETLYYAEKRGYNNKQMQIGLKESLLALLPTPVLQYFGLYIDKTKKEFSRGDLLYGSGFGWYRVTSHVGDGLATFGFWYFPIQFLAFLVVFKLLNCYVYFTTSSIKYAPFALIGVFNFLGMFRNAQGIYADFMFILRDFLQGIITYLLIFYIIKLALKFFDANISRIRSRVN